MIKYAVCGVISGLLLTSSLRAEECVQSTGPVVTFHFGVETVLPDPNLPDVFELGHTDLNFPFASGQWQAFIDSTDGPGGAAGAPESSLLFVDADARVTLTTIPPAFDFIGAAPGVPFWILPQNPEPSVLFLGMAADTMSSGDLASLCEWNPGDPRGGADVPAKWIRIELLDVRGPVNGEFSMWQVSTGAPTVYFSSLEGGVDASDVIHVLAGSHTHMNWALTEPGSYEVDLRASTMIVAPDCPADLTGDGAVNQLDLNLLLAEFGCSAGCSADITGDGAVNQLDLNLLLASFGEPC